MIGQRVYQYQILEMIGAGGMGVVYKAEDTKLRRLVALKFLSRELVDDVEFNHRFRREAYAASALNHPHICTVYDIDNFEGQPFIALEFLDGQPLDRLAASGPLELSRVLALGIQLTDALEVAHGQGILHRDIKPGNILVSPRGQAKILDFGLAKWTTREFLVKSAGATEAAVTSGMSIWGTPVYMSPEQVSGEELDARSDLFSLGAVLYEIATGRRAFDRATAPLVFDAILNREPTPAADVNSQIDPRIAVIISKALQKSRALRYQSASEMKSDLTNLQREIEFGKSGAIPRPAPMYWRFVALASVTLALLSYSVWRFAERTPDSGMQAATFTQLSNMTGAELFPSLTPDGRFLIFASRLAGNWDIYLQRVGGQNASNLTADSTADDTQPALSPDGNLIAFRSERDGGGIYVMGATGESPRRVTSFGYNPSWSSDGRKLAFAAESVIDAPNDRAVRSALWTVSIDTGSPVKISDGDAVQPAWSPKGYRIAYWAFGGSGQRDLWTVRADGSNPVQVTNDAALDWSPAWSPDGGYLYFSSEEGGNSNLWRIPIDEASGRVTGPRQAVTSGGGPALRAHPNISRDGRHITYVEEIVASDVVQKVAFDGASAQVSGTPAPLSQDTRAARHPDPSPDGQWLTYMTWGKQDDIFVIRPDGTGQRQLTNDIYKDVVPRWSPDGSRIAFFSNRSGSFEIWTIRPDGSDLKQLTHYQGPRVGFVRSVWSPDGGRIATYVPEEGSSIIDLDRSGNPVATHLLPAPPDADELFDVWSWSPDSRWLAGSRIHKSSGAATGISLYDIEKHTYQALTDFGTLPVWLKDSRRLLFEFSGQVYVADRISAKARQVFAFGPHTIYNLGQLPPDNRWLYFGLLAREADIWLMTLK